MASNELNELLKLILLPLLGVLATWLAGKIRPKPEKERDQIAADRAGFELWRDQLGWAKEEIRELRQTMDGQQDKIASLERRLASITGEHADLQSYARGLVRWIKDLLRVLEDTPNGMVILGRVAAPLPDLEAEFTLTSKKEHVG